MTVTTGDKEEFGMAENGTDNMEESMEGNMEENEDGALDDGASYEGELEGDAISSLTEKEMERLLDFFDQLIAERSASLEGMGVDSVGDEGGDDDGNVSDESVKEKEPAKGKGKVSDENMKRKPRGRGEPADDTQRNIADVLEGLRF